MIQAVSPVKNAQKAKPIPFDQVKVAIKQQLIQQKKQDEMTKWWNDQKKSFAKKTAYQTGYAPPATAPQTTTTGFPARRDGNTAVAVENVRDPVSFPAPGL